MVLFSSTEHFVILRNSVCMNNKLNVNSLCLIENIVCAQASNAVNISVISNKMATSNW